MIKKIRRLLLALLLAGSTPAFAAEPADPASATRRGECPQFSTCLEPSVGVVQGSTATDAAVDAVPSDVVETNSSAIFNAFVVTSDGDANDTGDEVCDLIGMDCVDVQRLDTYAASACGTDTTGQTVLVWCN